MTNIAPEARENNVPADPTARELALRRYDVVIKYYIYENAAYWTRNQFFAAIHAGILAFFAARFNSGSFDLVVLSFIGVLASAFWINTISAAHYWIARWHRICEILEPLAFEDIEVFRNCRPPEGERVKPLAMAVAWISVAVWLLALGLALIKINSN